MVDGRAGEDALLGPSGLVTPVATPEATARAIVNLAKHPERHAAMATAGAERTYRYYRQEYVYEAYRDLYTDLGATLVGGRR
jgi:glycosyltransferase involved in cell wall biosynthesis